MRVTAQLIIEQSRDVSFVYKRYDIETGYIISTIKINPFVKI
jgi:hypothetical protein